METVSDSPAARRASGEGVGVRLVMLGWCLWLLGSWAVTLTLDSPVPAVRWMVFAVFTGLAVVWPVVRLSQDTRPGGGRVWTIVIDWVCLVLIFQAVVWPLSLVAGWTWQQALWIDAAITAWSLLMGAVVALGRLFASAVARGAAMAACLLLILGAPALRTIAGVGTPGQGGAGAQEWTQGLEPLTLLWRLTQRPVDVDLPGVAPSVVAAALAALAAWAGVLIVSRWRPTPRTPPDPSDPRDPQDTPNPRETTTPPGLSDRPAADG